MQKQRGSAGKENIMKKVYLVTFYYGQPGKGQIKTTRYVLAENPEDAERMGYELGDLFEFFYGWVEVEPAKNPPSNPWTWEDIEEEWKNK